MLFQNNFNFQHHLKLQFFFKILNEAKERIVFTMMCVFFFLSVSISDSKRSLIFEISTFSDRKVNLFGTNFWEVKIKNYK